MEKLYTVSKNKTGSSLTDQSAIREELRAFEERSARQE